MLHMTVCPTEELVTVLQKGFVYWKQEVVTVVPRAKKALVCQSKEHEIVSLGQENDNHCFVRFLDYSPTPQRFPPQDISFRPLIWWPLPHGKNE